MADDSEGSVVNSVGCTIGSRSGMVVLGVCVSLGMVDSGGGLGGGTFDSGDWEWIPMDA